MRKVKIEKFEGPLDVLLQLIEDDKLEITEVSLVEVTEQYIKLLQSSAQAEIKTEELADFLVVAARLMLIKSRALLPFLEWEDDTNDAEELTRQLKIYKEYLEASKKIQARIAKKRFSFSRERVRISREVSFSPPPSISTTGLASIFAQVVRALDPLQNLPSEVVRKAISIQEKIQNIREYISKQASGKFSEILRGAKDKTDIVISFLALLELMKQQIIIVKQDENFGDIAIRGIK